MIKYRVKIIDIVEEAKGTKTYYFEKPEDLTWDEGSHLHVGLKGFDDEEQPNKKLVRHMSIATLPSENKLAFTTRVPGSDTEFKEELSKVNVGDEITLFKIGSRMSLRRSGQPVVLISMGVGIATMRPIIHTFIENDEKVPALYNINLDSSGEFVYREELDKLENDVYKNFWMHNRDSFYKEVKKAVEIENAVYYIVGSNPFISNTLKELSKKNVDPKNIMLDKKELEFNQFFKMI